ncbi:hypothetical protein [Rhodococcus sp. NPDC060176]|uniref:hypothetical protein n=1 Tax=Rhodococcus sp. NPDC060176 TaxID=3347062 RepID=UPI003669CD57
MSQQFKRGAVSAPEYRTLQSEGGLRAVPNGQRCSRLQAYGLPTAVGGAPSAGRHASIRARTSHDGLV